MITQKGRKFLSGIAVLCAALLVNTMSVAATQTQTADIEAPVIDKTSITVSPAAAKPGDTVTFSVKVTDNMEVSGVTALVVNQTANVQYSVRFTNSGNDIWTGTKLQDISFDNGDWIIESISAYDNSANNTAGANYTTLTNTVVRPTATEKPATNDYVASLPNAKYTLSGAGQSDKTPPVIDITSLKITPTTATTGQEFQISFQATDDQSKPKMAKAVFEIPTPNSTTTEYELITAYLDPTTTEAGTFTYSGTLPVDTNMLPGTYKLAYLTASSYTDVTATSYYYNNQAISNKYAKEDPANFVYVKDLSSYNYNLTIQGTNPDRIPPVIDTTSLKVSSDAVKSGQPVTLSAKVTDNVGVTEVYFSLKSPVRNETKILYAKDPDGDGIFTVDMPTDMNTENGIWQVASITAYDAANMRTSLLRSDPQYADILTKLDFGVSYNGDVRPTTATTTTTTTATSATTQGTTTTQKVTTPVSSATTAANTTTTTTVNGTTTTVPATTTTAPVVTTTVANVTGTVKSTTGKPNHTTGQRVPVNTNSSVKKDLAKTGEVGQTMILAGSLTLLGAAIILLVLRRRTNEK